MWCLSNKTRFTAAARTCSLRSVVEHSKELTVAQCGPYSGENNSAAQMTSVLYHLGSCRQEANCATIPLTFVTGWHKSKYLIVAVFSFIFAIIVARKPGISFLFTIKTRAKH